LERLTGGERGADVARKVMRLVDDLHRAVAERDRFGVAAREAAGGAAFPP